MKSYLKLLFLLITLPCFSQWYYEDYTWTQKPDYSSYVKNSREPIIAVKDKKVVEFAYEAQGELTEYYLEHQVLWLNSDEKIESYNKVYLPYSNSSQLLTAKARVINKKGKIIELDDSKILTAEDEETGRKYKYFAFEGIEKGSFVEYYFVEKKYPHYKGKLIRLQGSFRKNNIEFDLFSPPNLVFKFKSYNQIPTVTKDTLSKKKRHWKLFIKELKGLEHESESPYHASKGSVVYKLDKNLNSNNSDISSYANIAQNIYQNLYAQPSKKVKELMETFISEAISENDTNEESKIRSLDRFIKTNIAISKGNNAELKSLEYILNNRVASSAGVMKLYVALLEVLNIKHEIVITSDRKEQKFDKEFESNNFLENFLIYFPKYKSYLYPEDALTRYGYPPGNFTDNYGLFIKEVKVGSFKSAVANIEYIPSLDASKSVDEMVIDVKFDEVNLSKNLIKVDRSFTGYFAQAFHPFMYLMKDKNKEEFFEAMGKDMATDVNLINSEVINEAPELFGIKPIHFIVDLETGSLTSKAGKKYLFRLGEIIGPQSQMYQEKKRTLPLESEFKRSYLRTINITLPEGYKVANLDDININNSFALNNEEVFSFKSYYEIKDNKIIITADEYYKLNIVNTSIFEHYRRVINSAADFNKIVLVLEPIGED
jgi:hypothetical protein